MIRGFRGAVGTAGVLFLLLAAFAWFLLPFAHPVYSLLVPSLIAGGAVFAFVRMRKTRRVPSIRPSSER